MKNTLVRSILALTLASITAAAQNQPMAAGGPPLKTTYVQLSNNANAIVVEPVTPDPVRGHIALLITHPERANNFNYFVGWDLARYGYRAMMVNYYGREQTYDEFLQPLAAAVKALRAMPGVDKVVLAGHSSGGAELTAYQDVAENGPAACTRADRVYKCNPKGLDNLPKADGVLMVDANTGAADKTMALNPAVNDHHPRLVNPALDMYSPRNGYDPATKGATYSKEFLSTFFAAQGAKANRVLAEAKGRLALIERGEGEYKDDEPFVVDGAGVLGSGAHVELADLHVMGTTHGTHPLLMPDGTTSVRVIRRTDAPSGGTYQDMLSQTTQDVTVRHYLSFQGLPVTADYHATEDNLYGVEWHGTANSLQGNLEGIKVPTLILAATCSVELVFLEISYDHSAAKDKEMVGVEGANHNFQPCKPEYGDTHKHAFDYMDNWLKKPGRF